MSKRHTLMIISIYNDKIILLEIKEMTLSIIVAMDDNNLIGNNNALPWCLPADLAYFKKTTTGKPVIMGRKTYDSIGRALPNRRNIVISRNTNLTINGVEVVNSIEAAIELTKRSAEVFIIGGAALYKQSLPLADKLYITKIQESFVGDAYFPSINSHEWQNIQSISHKPDNNNPHAYCFEVLKKQASPLNKTFA